MDLDASLNGPFLSSPNVLIDPKVKVQRSRNVTSKLQPPRSWNAPKDSNIQDIHICQVAPIEAQKPTQLIKSRLASKTPARTALDSLAPHPSGVLPTRPRETFFSIADFLVREWPSTKDTHSDSLGLISPSSEWLPTHSAKRELPLHCRAAFLV